MALSMIGTFGLGFFVGMNTLWRRIEAGIPKDKTNYVQIGLRFVIILLIGALTMAIPSITIVIDLVGAIFLSSLGKNIEKVVS